MRRSPIVRTPFKPKATWKRLERKAQLPRSPAGITSTKRINPVSKRRKRVSRDYRRERLAYLAVHRECEAGVGGCTGRTADIHHVLSRGRSGRDADLTDRANFLAVCRNCHDWIESNRAEAHRRGWLKHAWD